MFSIIYELVYGIKYKNSKKEKRVMRHLEIHRFCDATLNRVLEGLKSYNNHVKFSEKPALSKSLDTTFVVSKPKIDVGSASQAKNKFVPYNPPSHEEMESSTTTLEPSNVQNFHQCSVNQARPTVKHLKEVKRIFWYLRQSYNMGLWYPKDSEFELIAYSDADHVGCKDDCKSTSGGLQFLGPEKIVLSLHKFLVIIFNDDDIEERTFRWVNKCVKKFNPYARYGVEHWKNTHAKIFYIRKQKEPGKLKEVIYSILNIIQVIKTYWELGHAHKFIRKIVVRRTNECIVSITEYDYKNLNKNDIEDMYLLITNSKLSNKNGRISTAPTISFLGIEKHKMLSIIYKPVHGIIYKNSKKEKRVMRHSEIHKFCDATLNRVLEGLKSYNNDVKYGYIQRDLTNDEVKYLKLFEEEIEVRLKYRNQMRRWEMYVNGRPLGPRRERPE
ncbi:hypothetical protein Tco_0844703 [Tanacetum coccineum]